MITFKRGRWLGVKNGIVKKFHTKEEAERYEGTISTIETKVVPETILEENTEQYKFFIFNEEE